MFAVSCLFQGPHHVMQALIKTSKAFTKKLVSLLAITILLKTLMVDNPEVNLVRNVSVPNIFGYAIPLNVVRLYIFGTNDINFAFFLIKK